MHTQECKDISCNWKVVCFGNSKYWKIWGWLSHLVKCFCLTTFSNYVLATLPNHLVGLHKSIWFRTENLVIWRTITSLALWTIWKMRCEVVFNNAHIHLSKMLVEFWLLFVHTIRGQYDDLQGSTDAQRQRQVDFKKLWRGLHLFSDTTAGMKWNYAIPPFLLHNL